MPCIRPLYLLKGVNDLARSLGCDFIKRVKVGQTVPKGCHKNDTEIVVKCRNRLSVISNGTHELTSYLFLC